MTAKGPQWPPTMVQRLRELWLEQNYTMAEIAEMLSGRHHWVSRSAVAGMVCRLGLTRCPTGPRKVKAEALKVREGRRGAQRGASAGEQNVTEPAPIAVRKVILVPPVVKVFAKPWARRVRSLPADGTPLPLLDLSARGCRWPVGFADGEHVFCNRPKRNARYCDLHGP